MLCKEIYCCCCYQRFFNQINICVHPKYYTRCAFVTTFLLSWHYSQNDDDDDAILFYACALCMKVKTLLPKFDSQCENGRFVLNAVIFVFHLTFHSSAYHLSVGRITLGEYSPQSIFLIELNNRISQILMRLIQSPEQ